jgi:hypothetical protein
VRPVCRRTNPISAPMSSRLNQANSSGRNSVSPQAAALIP